MLHKLKKYLAICFFVLVSACAGTGTRDITSISFTKPTAVGESNLFFYRESKYVAGGQLIKVLVNGQEIGKLGNGEFEKFKVKAGQTSIKAGISNILALGMTTDNYSFTAKSGENYYFLLSYNQKFFTGGWKITETSERGFKNAVQ